MCYENVSGKEPISADEGAQNGPFSKNNNQASKEQ
jgi:hypothetical protein